MLTIEQDSDNDGVVSTEELQRAAEMMNKSLPTELVKHVVARMDKDQDGKIPLEELKKYAKEERLAHEEEPREDRRASKIIVDALEKAANKVKNESPKHPTSSA